MKFTKEKGITLIALVITIIVLIILAGISINLVLGQNGLFNKAKRASVETQKAKFVEDAGLAYLESYSDKLYKTNSSTITVGDIVSKMKSSYGYTEEQIKKVTNGVSSIILSEAEVTLGPGKTTEITVELESGTYYVLIEDIYYPIALSDKEITLGEGVEKLPTGDEEEKTFEVKVTEGSEKVEITVEGAKITIKAKLRT